MENSYKEFRCPKCHKLLFKGLLDRGDDKVEIKCRGCGDICTFYGSGNVKVENHQPPLKEGSTGITGTKSILYLLGISLPALYLLSQMPIG